MTLAIFDQTLDMGADGNTLQVLASQPHGFKFGPPSGGVPFFRSSGMSVPLAAGFSGTLGTLATVTDKSDRLQVTKASAATAMSMLFVAAPAAPYTLDICGALQGGVNAGDDSLLGAARSDGTKLQVIWGGVAGVAANQNPIVVQKWNSTTGPVVTSATSDSTVNPALMYLRIIDDATTCFYLYSVNGKDYVLSFSEARNTFLTANRVGVAFYYTRPAAFAGDGKYAVYDLTTTPSVLGDAP